MISVAEADSVLAAQPLPKGSETVPLEQAVGRVLARALVADRDGPPYDRVAMDGFAVGTADGVRVWTVQGLQSAGKPPLDRTEQATAIEVATGAILPAGCDAVIPYEVTTRDGDTVTLVPDRAPPSSGDHVHRQGTDYRRGEVLLPSGTRLRSPHLHALATVGITAELQDWQKKKPGH